MTLKSILERDYALRKEDKDDDLYGLEDIRTITTDMHYECPTIVHGEFIYNDETEKKIDIQREFNPKQLNTAQFNDTFLKKYPYLAYMDWGNKLVAGGSIIQIMNDKPVNDIDIFFYGCTEDTANTQLQSFLKHIKNYISIVNEYNTKSIKLRLSKTQYTVDVYLTHENGDCDKIQLITCVFDSLSQVLQSFDLGSSTIGYDGNRLYFTTLSKFCIENMCNIVDLSKQSRTYGHRLQKYFWRGFKIVLPDLDTNKLKQAMESKELLRYCGITFGKYCETKSLGFVIKDITDNKITVTSISLAIDIDEAWKNYGKKRKHGYGYGNGKTLSMKIDTKIDWTKALQGICIRRFRTASEDPKEFYGEFYKM